MTFSLEAIHHLPLPTTADIDQNSINTNAITTPVYVYRHSLSNARIIHSPLHSDIDTTNMMDNGNNVSVDARSSPSINVQHPLVSLTVVVPTLSCDDTGLPHTLEHLIFCGSHHHPHRGYLDTLATRSLSTGTNAYTDYDHTAYTYATASAEGVLLLAPVFLNHILRPSLTRSHFTTEVFHYDHLARPQGVVYCEMAARENTESDIVIQ